MHYVCLIVTILFSSVTLSETLTLGTFHIPLLAESADKGLFVDVAHAVAEESGIDIDILFLPTQRTREAFATQRLDGFFPAISQTLDMPYSASTAFSEKRVYAFTRRADAVITSSEQLANKRVGYTEGFTYSHDLMNVDGAQYQATMTDPQSIKKLLVGRIDVFLGDEIAVLEAIHQQRADDKIHYAAASPMVELPIFFAFQDDPRGQMLASRFSEAIARLKENGTLARILQMQ